MEWHWSELSSLLHHLPHSLHDLSKHEDKQLVESAIGGFRRELPKPEQKHRLLIPETPVASGSPKIALEKDIDSSVFRSEQNLGLLVHDYLHTLPVYTPTTTQADALLEHWRTILLEQPQRLQEAQHNYWGSEHAKEYWRQHIKHYKTDFNISADSFPNAMDDWEKLAGAPAPHPVTLGAAKARQWQDLVIRKRLHTLAQSILEHDR